MAAQRFRINIPDSMLEDLRERLARTRFAKGIGNAGWDYGTDPAYLMALCRYWQETFDWRRQEAFLNGFRHYRSEIDGVGIHFLHQKGRDAVSIPLLMVHGWPDSFARFLKIAPLLTDPKDEGPSFDIVVPSLPGFGFSDRPKKKGEIFRVHNLLHTLMTEELGYRRFAMHGGDWGGTVTEYMARSHASSLIGIHLTDVPFFHMFEKPDDLSAAEQKYLAKMEDFPKKKGAYAMVQSTQPQSLAAGLNDSPSGLAAWLVEKFRAWTDCGGDLESVLTRDEILTHLMIYWTTGSIDSSFYPYYDMANASAFRWMAETVKGWLGSKSVPAGFALFPKDLSSPPREWAERFFNVQRWTQMSRGGHFGAMEEPELLAQELRAMFVPLWAEVREQSAA
jgi:pimeloyl-ACP methyl ester carboxylesterase